MQKKSNKFTSVIQTDNTQELSLKKDAGRSTLYFTEIT